MFNFAQTARTTVSNFDGSQPSLPLQSNGTFYPKGALSQDPGNQRFIEKRPQSSYQRFSSAANGTVKEAVGKVADAKLLVIYGEEYAQTGRFIVPVLSNHRDVILGVAISRKRPCE